jgi:hypothetical protein
VACAGRVFEKSWIPFRSGDPIPHDSGSGPSGLSGCCRVADLFPHSKRPG